MKKKKKWLKWLIILAVLALAFVIFVLPTLRSVSDALYQQDTVARGDISTYYSFSGDLVLAKSESHAATSDCEVRDVYVSEGDAVKKDDRLMRLSDGTAIKAGIAGEVTDLDVERDDAVSAGQALVSVADFDSMRVEFDVDEFDVDAVHVGTDAQITIDALDYTFTLPITRISKTPRTSGDITYYTARADMDACDAPDAALPGMRVDVKVLGAYAGDALMIKMDALSFDEYNKPYVLIQSGDEKVRQYVGTGINDGVYVEITDGLSEGDTVYYMAKLSDIEQLMQMRSSSMSGSK